MYVCGGCIVLQPLPPMSSSTANELTQPYSMTPAKRFSLYFLTLGRLAPYLERRCVRLATPAVSSVPRTMW